MRKYPKYKDSGIDWASQIPEHWEVKRLKHIKSDVKNAFVDGPFGSNLKTEHFIENGEVYVIDSGYVTSGVFEFHRDFKTITKEHFETVKRSECHENDIIISKIGANFGMSGILPKLDKPSLVSGNTLKLTINNEKYYLEFIHLQLLNLKLFGEIDLLVKGSAQPALSMGTMNNLPFFVPNNLEEQTQIANYLDNKTKQIDTLIANKQKLIELLQEERTAIINHAVTKGINPKVKLKPSGIDWLGDIPENWEVSRIKYVTDIVGRIGFRGYTTADLVPKGEGAISLSPSNVKNQTLTIDDCTYLSWEKYNESPEIQIFEDDIILVKTGSTIGKVALIPKGQPEMTLNPQLVVLKNIKLEASYLYYIMISDYLQFYFDLYSAGGSTPAISQEKINNFKIVFPPKNEQLTIVNWIKEKQNEIDKIIVKTEQEIELMKEYKTALISEVVTGKVDVRDEPIK